MHENRPDIRGDYIVRQVVKRRRKILIINVRIELKCEKMAVIIDNKLDKSEAKAVSNSHKNVIY